MNSKVDKLFKEKMETHTLQPSAQAWEKVESHLSKKNKMVVWLRIAAAVALLGLLTFAALNWGVYKSPKIEMVKEQINPGQIKPQEQPTVAPEQEKEEEKKQVAEAPVKKKFQTKKVLVPVVVDEPEITEEQVAVVDVPEVTPLTDRTGNANQMAEKKVERSITLTYSLPSIKTEQPAEPAVAEVTEVKKTGFERVLEIAKEVKNADNPLGELREAKDDILAFEFKKDRDKTKKNN
jgi:cytoskeletal protein RodZ